MDQLAIHTTQQKTQSVKLKHAQQEIDKLKFDRTGIRTLVSDVISLLSNLLEAHDPILTITIRRNIADKLCPVIAMLNRIEGVLEVPVIPEQGGEKTKGNTKVEKGKEPMGNYDENDDSEEEQLKRKAHDHELDENARIVREAEEKERKEKEAHDTLECRKLLFPLWTLERMLHEAVHLPSVHWLEPVASFDLVNTKLFIFQVYSSVF
ncbi:unnamed protein product [Lactuca saligna]|uniref:Uncharacterized protein n=1 Tax=Lactuca saligna TaxID=75948 RepID=A0AA36EI70_LACSI|nr:unnamed protein product [Lactuca saligna]